MPIKSKIESLLFISAKPMGVKQLAGLIKEKEKETEEAGNALVEDYKNNQCGIQIIKNGPKYQMVSSPENAAVVQEFIKDETTGELSRPSLEALTIIAYRGPVSKIDLDRIRGVNCALILRNLLLRGLIETKFDKKKNETYYTVTFDFIRFLGINDTHELPDYERLRQDDTIDRMLGNADGPAVGGESAEDKAGTDGGAPAEEAEGEDTEDGGYEPGEDGSEAAEEETDGGGESAASGS